MTAAVLTGHGEPDVLQVRDDVPVPQPAAGQVLVQVSAAAVNNTDIWTRQGAYGLPGQPEALAGWRGPIDFPRIQAGDIAGTVAAAGVGVPQDQVGKRVLVDPAFYQDLGLHAAPVGLLGSEADGGFADYVAVAADQVHDMTDAPLSDEELACLPVAYGTAMGMLERVELGTGETVLVTGASGGVGLALVQFATARGATVIALTGPAKADQIRAAGADHILTRGKDDLPSQLKSLVPSVDVVADVVGGSLLGELMPLLVDDGRWVIAGAVAGAVIPFDLRRLYLHNRRLIGSSMHTRTHFALLAQAARAGQLHPRIAGRYRLPEIHEAQQQFQKGEHVGKIIVRP
jgi:NADPH:quinone reductase-like Zn-dependent oxidoreductase